jgi:peptidoglycan-N-acetylglucosamine deacetylase
MMNTNHTSTRYSGALLVIFTLSLITGLWLISHASAGQNQPDSWNGHRSAVVLTYDDGLNVHLDKVIPALNKAGVRGTFYIQGNAHTLHTRMKEWRKAAAKGHELGNHTLFHPCAGSPPGRGFVTADYDLDTYTLRRITDEIKLANTLLKAVDGREKRTIAYTCGDHKAGTTDFIPQIMDDFTGARGVASRMENIESVNLYNIGAYMMSGQSGEEMINLVKQAQESGRLLVFLFHGVGGEHGLNVSLEAHNQLVDYLQKNKREIWITTMTEVAEFAGKK